MIRQIAFAIAAIGLAQVSRAYEVVQARVTIVEGSYMPSQVFFQADIGSTSCPANTWLRWFNSANVDSNKAIFGLLLAAVNSGNRIQYFINNGDTTCQVQFLYALPP